MIPKAVDGFIKTKNKMGYSLDRPDELVQAYLDCCKKESQALDIGSGYGIFTKMALEKGSYVTSVDLESEHLKIQSDILQQRYASKISFKCGDFSKGSILMENQYDSILASQVLHFLKGNDFNLALQKIHSALSDSGQAFLSLATPYTGIYKKFIPVFEENKNNHLPFPGLLNDMKKFTTARQTDLPSFINLFDTDTFSAHLERAKFKILKIWMYTRDSLAEDMKYDGREVLGAIVQKQA